MEHVNNDSTEQVEVSRAFLVRNCIFSRSVTYVKPYKSANMHQALRVHCVLGDVAMCFRHNKPKLRVAVSC